MVYKKFVIRCGKKFGPYYYKSYRTEKGVKKIYIGGQKEYDDWLKKEGKSKEEKRGIINKIRCGTTFSKLFKIRNMNNHIKKIDKKWFVIPLIILLLISGGFLFTQLRITTRAVVELENNQLRIELKAGELLPADTMVLIRDRKSVV